METKVSKAIQQFLVKKVNPAFIIVFGSHAKGTNRSDSDIDIAFYNLDTTFSSYERFMIAQELADILNVEVDLVDLRNASTVFLAQIFSEGEVIYSKDEESRQRMHMTAYSMYARLNEERKPILDKIQESGSVYGG